MSEIILPNNWRPRAYQKKVWKYLENGGKRAMLPWHRRAGKDDVALHWTAVSAMKRVGNYWHMLPEASQARKAIWDAINPHTGLRRIDEAFPKEIRKRTVDNEMKIELITGSFWQVVGSDNFNSLVGTPPIGITFSEWAIANPSSWAYLRPILAENGGWAIFPFTPRGRNHAATHYEAAINDPNWFCQKLTAHDTDVFSKETLERELKEYIALYGQDEGTARYEQEYFCSFDAAIIGSYYGSIINEIESQGRITSVPYDPSYPVYTAWDIGFRDSTVIWFVQVVGTEVRVIDYYEANGVPLSHYLQVLKDRGYTYATDICPHDIEHHELITGTTRLKVLQEHGREVIVLERADVQDGIEAVRRLLRRCLFDREKCAKGLDALRQYRKEWHDERKIFSLRPVHDWTSHAADGFRTLAMGIDQAAAQRKWKSNWSGSMRSEMSIC